MIFFAFISLYSFTCEKINILPKSASFVEISLRFELFLRIFTNFVITAFSALLLGNQLYLLTFKSSLGSSLNLFALVNEKYDIQVILISRISIVLLVYKLFFVTLLLRLACYGTSSISWLISGTYAVLNTEWIFLDLNSRYY